MKVEDTEWSPEGRKVRVPAKSILALQSLKAGDIKRIIHDDVYCRVGSGTVGSCALATAIARQRTRESWELEYYHENQHVLVVRRLK